MKFFQIIIFIISLKINTIFGISTLTDKIVAIVNDNIILDSDITNKINFMKYDMFNYNLHTFQNNRLYYTILDQLIIDNLIYQIATKENIKINSNQPNQVIKYAAKIRNMTINQFYSHLNNISIDHDKYFLEIYQEILKKDICAQIGHQYNYIELNEIKKTAQNLNYIDLNKQFKITHIIIELPILASPSRINQSQEFAKLLIQAKQTHQDLQKFIHSYYYENQILFPRVTIQKTKWITWENVPIIFDKHLKTAKSGDIIGPIYSYDGIHILEIEDIYINKYIYPIIKIKINDIISKDKTNNIQDIKQKLLKIKEQIENEDSTLHIILQEQSKNFYSKNHGNLLKWINLSQFDLETQKVLMNLKKNQISMPIYTNNKWCLIKLVDIDKLNYSEVIYERAYYHILYQRFNEILQNWIQELKSKSYIKIIN